MKTAQELEDEILYLLECSKFREAGPHGRTISAVMKRVRLLKQRAARRPKK